MTTCLREDDNDIRLELVFSLNPTWRTNGAKSIEQRYFCRKSTIYLMKLGNSLCRRIKATSLCHAPTKRLKMGWRKALASVSFAAALGIVLFMYYCGSDFCTGKPIIETNNFMTAIPKSEFEAYKQGMLPANTFDTSDVSGKLFDVNLDKEDVFVFLHIQKTGGTTFGKHLVRNLDLDSPCKCHKHKKQCDCYTRKKTVWLISRYSTGWICGLHADWTELNVCVESAMNKEEKKVRSRK